MKHRALLLISFLLLISSCEQVDAVFPDSEAETVKELPPATSTGANTFGCLINGEVWVNSFGSWLQNNVDASYSSNYRILNLSAQDSSGEISEGISMSAILEHIGTFPLNHANFGVRPEPCDRFISAQDIPLDDDNFLKITRLDFEERIVSGRFAFVLVDQHCGDTLRITDGRFDLLI